MLQTTINAPTIHVLLLAALYRESSRRSVAEGTTLAHVVGQAQPFTEFGDLPDTAKRGLILTASALLQQIDITDVADDPQGPPNADQLAWLAEVIHNAEREAIEAGLVAVKLDPPRPWVEYSELPAGAQQGRQQQAAFFLQRFQIEPRLTMAPEFPKSWDLERQCEAVIKLFDRLLAEAGPASLSTPDSTANALALGLLALRGAAEQTRGLGLLKAQSEAVLNDISGASASEDEALKSAIFEKDTPATAARLLQIGMERGAFAILDSGDEGSGELASDDPTVTGVGTNASDATRAQGLWRLLDDIDTADDMAAEDDRLFRGMAMQAARRRELYLTCPDGHTLVPVLEGERTGIAERIKQWEEKLEAERQRSFGEHLLRTEAAREAAREASDALDVMTFMQIRSILEGILGRTPDPARDTLQLAREVQHYTEVMREEIRTGGRSSTETFREALQSTINRHSRENGSNTPDYVLANFLAGVLDQFDCATLLRDRFYGVELKPGSVVGKGELPADLWEPDASSHGEQAEGSDPEAPKRAIRRAATAKLEQLAAGLETSMPALAADLRRRYLSRG